MTVELRLIGEPEEIEAVLAVLGTEMEVAQSRRRRTYEADGKFGVRRYAEVRPRRGAAGPTKAAAVRTDRAELPGRAQLPRGGR
jgi:hypothetical protein